jgi:uncharacterized Zn finger protein
MSSLHCPSCGGRIELLKCIVHTLDDGIFSTVDFLAVARCTNCALVSECDLDKGTLKDVGLSMSLMFERPMRPLVYGVGLLRGRKDS